MTVTEDEKQEQTASTWIWMRMQWQALQMTGSAPNQALGVKAAEYVPVVLPATAF